MPFELSWRPGGSVGLLINLFGFFLGKLIEKMIARRLQFDAVKYGILHPNQLGGVAQWSTEDAGVFLMHLVRAG